MPCSRNFLLLFLIMLSGPAVIAAGGSISFDKESHDYGRVLYGNSVKHQFVISNTGTQTLTIEKLHATCGCTRTMKGSSEIPPGGKTTLEAEFDTNGLRPGRKEKSIYVHSNDPIRPVVRLTLLADVVRDMSVEPPSLARHLTKFEDTISFPMKLHNSADKPYSVTGIKSPSGSLPGALQPSMVRADPGATVPFTLTLNLTRDIDRYYYMGSIVLETDHPRESEIEVRYLIKVEKTN
jgi:hypothetical protein